MYKQLILLISVLFHISCSNQTDFNKKYSYQDEKKYTNCQDIPLAKLYTVVKVFCIGSSNEIQCRATVEDSDGFKFNITIDQVIIPKDIVYEIERRCVGSKSEYKWHLLNL
jgi:hypothetical protein